MLEEKHGIRALRDWRKLHLAVDADNFSIMVHTLTDSHTDNPSQVGPLLSQTEDIVTQVTADGAYDGRPTYSTIAGYGENITVAIIQDKGRLAWQKAVGVRETGTGGNDDGVLENPHWYPTARPGFCGTEDRGCYRGGSAESSAVGGPASFCP